MGRLMEMGGGLRIVNAAKSLIFDEQLLEPGMKFSSNRLEAVCAFASNAVRVSVIVANTTAQPLALSGQAIMTGVNSAYPFQGQLGAYQTEVVTLPAGLIRGSAAGALSLQHNGGKGALMAIVHLSDAARGYSETINFTDPAQGKTTEWHGAGLRLGSIGNDALRPVIVARNISNQPTTLKADVPYAKQNGATGRIALPTVQLASGEIKLLDTSNAQLRQTDFATAGLELNYSGAPGSVIASATSISASGNQVFALPLKDPQGGMSSTGGYPWFINGSASTVVFIKNATKEAQEFMLSIVHSAGQWSSNIRRLEAGQTYLLDVRKLRDAQEKGADGSVIPATATSGHVAWSARGKQRKTLIGRAQTLDLNKALASSYECQCICDWSWGDEARLTPGAVSGFPGDVQTFLVQSRYRDCYWNDKGWWTVGSHFLNNYVTHSSDNPAVATYTVPSTGRAIGPGSTYLRAEYPEYYNQLNENFECVAIAATAACAAFCNVQTCVLPTGESFAPMGWGDSVDWPTAAGWMQTLLPTTTSFVGRAVFETDPGGGTDECHFPDSILAPQPTCCDPVNPDSWPVTAGNKWGLGYVGWLPESVECYRTARLTRGLPLPCRFTYRQRMMINCDASGDIRAYVTNILVGQIDVTTVASGRNGSFVEREWPVN